MNPAGICRGRALQVALTPVFDMAMKLATSSWLTPQGLCPVGRKTTRRQLEESPLIFAIVL